MANNQIVNRLKKFFNIADVKSSSGYSGDTQKQVHPGYSDPKTNNLRPVKFSDDMQALYEFWLRDTFEDSTTLKNRLERYAALSYAYYNNAIFSKAVNLYADETVQSDAQDQIIGVEAKNKKIENYIKDFLNDIGITNEQYLWDIAYNLTLYGDSFWVTSINMKDNKIEDINPIKIMDLRERIEFNALDTINRQNELRNYTPYIQKDSKLQALYQIMKDASEKKDFSSYFKSYLFGYLIGDNLYLPPWGVMHFRMFTSISEFYPYGRPIMINSLAPFRQLQAGKNLMALARAQSFPIKHFEVKVDENMDQMDQWESVNEARQEYHNIAGIQQSGKEQFAVGGEIWTPEGLISMNSIENRMNLDDIADIELLRDELIMGTDIPKGYLIVDRASFGTSGQSLLRQHKPFARAIYKIQSAILKEIAQLVRIQFMISGDFDIDEPFELTMQFPEIEESSDRLRMKNDMLRLAKDVMDNIGDAIGLDRDEKLPKDVVKDIFSQLSFLDSEDVDKWIDPAVEEMEKAEAEAESDDEDSGMEFGFENSIKRITPQLVKECYFRAKRSGKSRMYESASNGRHFYSSFKITDQEKMNLEMISYQKNIKKLEESD